MQSYTVKEKGIYSFWIQLHELDAEYKIDEQNNVESLTVYLKREQNEFTDSMRRSIRKGGLIQLQKNAIKTTRNILAVTRLSNDVTFVQPSKM